MKPRTPQTIGVVLVWVAIATIIGLLGLAVVTGCATDVYEYRTTVENPEKTSLRSYGSNAPPIVRDGYVAIDGEFVPAERVTWKRVQIGPHKCECGNVLRTYRDRCSSCGRKILLGRRTPP